MTTTSSDKSMLQELFDRIDRLETKFTERLDANIKATNDRISEFDKKLEIYQRASDRVANLAFTVVTASAVVVVLAPFAKVVADFAAKYLPQ